MFRAECNCGYMRGLKCGAQCGAQCGDHCGDWWGVWCGTWCVPKVNNGDWCGAWCGPTGHGGDQCEDRGENPSLAEITSQFQHWHQVHQFHKGYINNLQQNNWCGLLLSVIGYGPSGSGVVDTNENEDRMQSAVTSKKSSTPNTTS